MVNRRLPRSLRVPGFPASVTGGGFTLIELLVTLVIIVVLTTMAYPSYSRFIATTRVKGASTDLYLALIKARSAAAKLNTDVTITPVAGVWQAGWQISYGTGNILGIENPLSGVTISNGPATVVYMSSGRTQAAASFTVSPANGDTSIQRCVSVDTGGHPYVKATAC